MNGLSAPVDVSSLEQRGESRWSVELTTKVRVEERGGVAEVLSRDIVSNSSQVNTEDSIRERIS